MPRGRPKGAKDKKARTHYRVLDPSKRKPGRKRIIPAGTSLEHKIWSAMKDRCLNPNHKDYKHYGGRGITVCERWLNSFSNFIEDIGKRPNPQLMLERRENNKGYSPENCYWATREQQAGNRRTNIWLEYKGEKMILAAWARRFSCHPAGISNMLKSKSFSEVYEYFSNKTLINVAEPKKRGRPPGSGKNRPKVSPLVEEKLEKALDKAAKESGIKPKGIVELMEEGMKAAGLTPIFISEPEKAKASDIIPFPEGWEKMSKTEKLKFFTATRK